MAARQVQVAFLIDTVQKENETQNVLRRRALTRCCLRILTQFAQLYENKFTLDIDDWQTSETLHTGHKLKWTYKLFNSENHVSKVENKKFKSFKSQNFDLFQDDLQKIFLVASSRSEKAKRQKSPMKRHRSKTVDYIQTKKSKSSICTNMLMETVSDLQWDQPDIASPVRVPRHMSLSTTTNTDRLNSSQLTVKPPPCTNFVFLLTNCPLDESGIERFVGKRVRDPQVIVESMVSDSLRHKFVDSNIALFWVDTMILSNPHKIVDSAISEQVDQGLSVVNGRVIPVECLVTVEPLNVDDAPESKPVCGDSGVPMSCVLSSYLRLSDAETSPSIQHGCLSMYKGQHGKTVHVCQLQFAPLTQLHETDLVHSPYHYIAVGVIPRSMVTIATMCKQTSGTVCRCSTTTTDDGMGRFLRILQHISDCQSYLVLEKRCNHEAMRLVLLSPLSHDSGLMTELDVFEAVTVERLVAWKCEGVSANGDGKEIMQNTGDTNEHKTTDNLMVSHKGDTSGNMDEVKGHNNLQQSQNDERQRRRKIKERLKFISSNVSDDSIKRETGAKKVNRVATGRHPMQSLQTWFPNDYSHTMSSLFNNLQKHCGELEFLNDGEKVMLKKLQKFYREENRSLCQKSIEKPASQSASETTSTKPTTRRPLNTTPFKRLRSSTSISARGERLVASGLQILKDRTSTEDLSSVVRGGSGVQRKESMSDVFVQEFTDVDSLVAHIHSVYEECITGAVSVDSCVETIVMCTMQYMQRNEPEQCLESVRSLLDTELFMSTTKLLERYSQYDNHAYKLTQLKSQLQQDLELIMYKAQVQLRLQLMSVQSEIDAEPPEKDINIMVMMLRTLLFMCDGNFLSEYLSSLVDSYLPTLPRTLTAIYDELMQPLPPTLADLASPSSSNSTSVAPMSNIPPPSQMSISSQASQPSSASSTIQSPRQRVSRRQSLAQRSRSISSRQIVVQTKPSTKSAKPKTTAMTTRSAKKKLKSSGDKNDGVRHVKRNLFLSPKSRTPTTPKKTPSKRTCLTPKRKLPKPEKSDVVKETPVSKQVKLEDMVNRRRKSQLVVDESPLKAPNTHTETAEQLTHKTRGMAVLRRSFYSSGPQSQSRNMEKYRQLAARIVGLPPSANNQDLDSQIPKQLQSPDRQFIFSQLAGSQSPNYNLRRTPSKTFVGGKGSTPKKFVPDSPSYNALERRMFSPNAIVTRAMGEGKSPHKLSGLDTLVNDSPFKTPTKWVSSCSGETSAAKRNVRRSGLFSPVRNQNTSTDQSHIPNNDSLMNRMDTVDSLVAESPLKCHESPKQLKQFTFHSSHQTTESTQIDNTESQSVNIDTKSKKWHKLSLKSPKHSIILNQDENLFTPPDKAVRRKRKRESLSPCDRACTTETCKSKTCVDKKPSPLQGTVRKLNLISPPKSDNNVMDSPNGKVIQMFGLDSPSRNTRTKTAESTTPHDRAKLNLFSVKTKNFADRSEKRRCLLTGVKNEDVGLVSDQMLGLSGKGDISIVTDKQMNTVVPPTELSSNLPPNPHATTTTPITFPKKIKFSPTDISPEGRKVSTVSPSGNTSQRTPPSTRRGRPREARTPEIDKWPRVKTTFGQQFGVKDNNINTRPKTTMPYNPVQNFDFSDNESIGDVFGFKDISPKNQSYRRRRPNSISPKFGPTTMLHTDDSQCSMGFDTSSHVETIRNTQKRDAAADDKTRNNDDSVQDTASDTNFYGRFSLLNSSASEGPQIKSPSVTPKVKTKYAKNVTPNSLHQLISSPIINSGDKKAVSNANKVADKRSKRTLQLK